MPSPAQPAYGIISPNFPQLQNKRLPRQIPKGTCRGRLPAARLVREPGFVPRSRARGLNPGPSHGRCRGNAWTTRPSRHCRVWGSGLKLSPAFAAACRRRLTRRSQHVLSPGPLVYIQALCRLAPLGGDGAEVKNIY